MELQGKRVLITGASRGIGRSLAVAMAGAGANVALVARDADALASLAAELGGTSHPTDLLDPVERGRLIARVEAEAGPIDVLVNNAGVMHAAAHWDLTAEQVAAQVELNLLVPVELCRQAVPHLLERGGGHIVNIASLAAVAAVAGMCTYAGTKAGISHFSAALRDELAGLPVGVTTVMVGGVPTEMLGHGEEYAPLHRGFERLRKVQLAPDTPPDKLAAAVVRGVERGTRTVWLPRRAVPFVALVQAPRSVVRLALARVPRRG